MRQCTRIGALLGQVELHIIRKEWEQAESIYAQCYDLTKTFSLSAEELEEVNMTLPIESIAATVV